MYHNKLSLSFSLQVKGNVILWQYAKWNILFMKNHSVEFNEMCTNEYVVNRKHLGMYEANDFCSKMKGQLHVIQSKTANDHISAMLEKYPNECEWGMCN